MKKRKTTFRLYRKIYPKANAYARREYVEPYEKETLSKGYYHGYVEGARAMRRHIRSLMGRAIADNLLRLTLGEPKEIKV